MVIEVSLVEAEKYFRKGADELNHPKCMLKVAEITQDEGEKNVYYELAAERGEIDAIHWIIEDFLTKKNYEEAWTKFESYKEHLSPDCKIELQDKITFETLKDKRDRDTISMEEMWVLAEHYESGTGTEKKLYAARELRDRAKFLDTSASAEAGKSKVFFSLAECIFTAREQKEISTKRKPVLKKPIKQDTLKQRQS